MDTITDRFMNKHYIFSAILSDLRITQRNAVSKLFDSEPEQTNLWRNILV